VGISLVLHAALVGVLLLAPRPQRPERLTDAPPSPDAGATIALAPPEAPPEPTPESPPETTPEAPPEPTRPVLPPEPAEPTPQPPAPEPVAPEPSEPDPPKAAPPEPAPPLPEPAPSDPAPSAFLPAPTTLLPPPAATAPSDRFDAPPPSLEAAARPSTQPASDPDTWSSDGAAPERAGRVSFAGVEGPRARRIVYLVDGSGATAGSLPEMFATLLDSVNALHPGQRFAVIVFREPPPGSPSGAGVELFPPPGSGIAPPSASGPAMAAPGARTLLSLEQWASAVQPEGRSRPLEGLRAAFSLEPDLIFLISRAIPRTLPAGLPGELPADPHAGEREAVLRELDRLNPPRGGEQAARPVVIKAVQFVADDPTGLLQAIAEAHGDGAGSYRVVPLDAGR
jgi:hypothetical protein